MAQSRVPIYNGVFVTDTAATPNAIQVRDATGNSSQTGVICTNINNTGGSVHGVKAVTAVATLDDTCTFVTIDGSSGAYALNLPVASASNGQEYWITMIVASHTVTLTSNGSDNICKLGTVTSTTYAFTAVGQGIHIWCNGTEWILGALS